MRVHLFKFNLMRSDGDSEAIEDQEACTGGTLIDGSNEAVLQLLFVLQRYFFV